MPSISFPSCDIEQNTIVGNIGQKNKMNSNGFTTEKYTADTNNSNIVIGTSNDGVIDTQSCKITLQNMNNEYNYYGSVELNMTDGRPVMNISSWTPNGIFGNTEDIDIAIGGKYQAGDANIILGNPTRILSGLTMNGSSITDTNDIITNNITPTTITDSAALTGTTNQYLSSQNGSILWQDLPSGIGGGTDTSNIVTNNITPTTITDSAALTGTTNQYLSAQNGSILWQDLPPGVGIPTLSQICTSTPGGDSADNITLRSLTVNSSTGEPGQYLQSSGITLQWANCPTLNDVCTSPTVDANTTSNIKLTTLTTGETTGDTGQYLQSLGSSMQWADMPTLEQICSRVYGSNIATTIGLTNLMDYTSSMGTPGQFLTKYSGGIKWANMKSAISTGTTSFFRPTSKSVLANTNTSLNTVGTNKPVNIPSPSTTAKFLISYTMTAPSAPSNCNIFSTVVRSIVDSNGVTVDTNVVCSTDLTSPINVTGNYIDAGSYLTGNIVTQRGTIIDSPSYLGNLFYIVWVYCTSSGFTNQSSMITVTQINP